MLWLPIVLSIAMVPAVGTSRPSSFERVAKRSPLYRLAVKLREAAPGIGRPLLSARTRDELKARLDETIASTEFADVVKVYLEVLPEFGIFDVDLILDESSLERLYVLAEKRYGRDFAATLRQTFECWREMFAVFHAHAGEIQDALDRIGPNAAAELLQSPAARIVLDNIAYSLAIGVALDESGAARVEIRDGNPQYIATELLGLARRMLADIDPIHGALRQAEDGLPDQIKRWVVRSDYSWQYNAETNEPVLIVVIVLRDEAPATARRINGNAEIARVVARSLGAIGIGQTLILRARLASEAA